MKFAVCKSLVLTTLLLAPTRPSTTRSTGNTKVAIGNTILQTLGILTLVSGPLFPPAHLFSRKHCEGLFLAELLVNLRRVACTESPAWRYQELLFNLRRVACTESQAWRYQHGDTRAELLAQSSLRRVTSMEILAQGHQHGDASIELLAQSHVQRAKRIEPSAQSEVQRARCKEPSAQS